MLHHHPGATARVNKIYKPACMYFCHLSVADSPLACQARVERTYLRVFHFAYMNEHVAPTCSVNVAACVSSEAAAESTRFQTLQCPLNSVASAVVRWYANAVCSCGSGDF